MIDLLSDRGLALSYAEYVGDEPERIKAVLSRAFASGDVVFCTGGIGATPDDHTRLCAAQALGVSLQLHPLAGNLRSADDLAAARLGVQSALAQQYLQLRTNDRLADL